MKKLKKNLINFVSLWVANAIVILVANLISKDNVVLGTKTMPYVAALLVTTFLLTAIIFLIKPALDWLKLKIEGDINWILIYLVTAIVAVWVLARLAMLTGFGISSYYIAIILGIIINIVQWVAGKILKPKAKWRFV